MRPYWKGHLKLALVSCPIALHTACSSAERIRPLFAAPQRVMNLMEALRQSIAQDQKPAVNVRPVTRAARKRASFGHADRETEPPQADRQTKIGLCPAVERAR